MAGGGVGIGVRPTPGEGGTEPGDIGVAGGWTGRVGGVVGGLDNSTLGVSGFLGISGLDEVG